MSQFIAADWDMTPEESALNNKVAELVGFKCWKKAKSSCDGERVIYCGSCGRYGHANCYGDGTGPIQLGCCQLRPTYTQSQEAMWELVDVFVKQGGGLTLQNIGDGKWVAFAELGDLARDANSESASYAVCKAIVAVMSNER